MLLLLLLLFYFKSISLLSIIAQTSLEVNAVIELTPFPVTTVPTHGFLLCS